MQQSKTKINQLRTLVSQLPQTLHVNSWSCGNTIRYNGREYQIWAGGMQPMFAGTFEQCKRAIDSEIEIVHARAELLTFV